MIYLILCIICSSLLVFMFRVFEHYHIEPFPAIVFNYITCVVCGLVCGGHTPASILAHSAHAPWLWLAAIMGIIFIHIFVLTGRTALRFGVSTASVAMKLGLVIPVFLAFFAYHEAVTWYKVAGIICALIAVVLCSLKDEKPHPAIKHAGIAFLLPLVVFIGNGLADSGSQLGNKLYFAKGSSDNFVLLVFVFAALTGICYLSYMAVTGMVRLRWKQMLGGIALGIPNYYSLLFLLKALAHVAGGSSVVFPVANIATVAGATLLSVLFFKEHLNLYNRIGLAFGVLCVLFIYLPMVVCLFHG
jgi:drug/metabolite transporter (DMT)-like permease